VLDLGRLRSELTAAAGDAGVEPGSLVVFVVDAPRRAGTTPVAYLHPDGSVWPDTVAVFRAVGPDRTGRFQGAHHRLAIWAELSGIPDAALGPMLRHELEHARRWELSGTRFFEADDLLRAAVRNAGGDGYARLPSEQEANAASAAYAARTMPESDLAALRASPDCAALVGAPESTSPVVEATLSELRRRADWGPWLDGAARAGYLTEVAAACAGWDEHAARARLKGRAEPELVSLPPL
jgi:hypothetical protein